MSTKIEELENEINELKAQRDSIEQQIKIKAKKIEEIEKNTQYFVSTFGEVEELTYFKKGEQEYWDIVKQGNVFHTKEEAEKERKRRVLKFEIEEFRNERNDGWEPDFDEYNKGKYCIAIFKNKLDTFVNYTTNTLPLFGYFRSVFDCERALEIFGKRILELYGK